jgi:hypothetical protein
MLITLLIGIAMQLVPALAEDQNPYEPGGGQYVDTKHPKESRDFYIVREGASDKCSIVEGDWGETPSGAVGSAPYAGKDYARAAIKKLAECKGGESGSDEENDSKHRKK